MKTITKTVDAQTDKIRKAMNFIFDELTSQIKTLKTTFKQGDNEISITFVDGNFIGSIHLQELSNAPIPDATQLSLPLFTQEGGMV